MAKVVSNDTIKINGILNIDNETGRISVEIEDEGVFPVDDLIARLDGKEVAISVGFKEEMF